MADDFKDYFWRAWEENRRLTLKVAHSFPNEKLIKATPVPEMRTFAKMLLEIAGLEQFLIRGLVEEIWEWDLDETTHPEFTDSKEVFTILKKTRNYTRRVWPTISE